MMYAALPCTDVRTDGVETCTVRRAARFVATFSRPTAPQYVNNNLNTTGKFANQNCRFRSAGRTAPIPCSRKQGLVHFGYSRFRFSIDFAKRFRLFGNVKIRFRFPLRHFKSFSSSRHHRCPTRGPHAHRQLPSHDERASSAAPPFSSHATAASFRDTSPRTDSRLPRVRSSFSPRVRGKRRDDRFFRVFHASHHGPRRRD